MFDHRHYVPVLRWKGAERAALQHLFLTDKNGLTPLLEIPPTDFASGADVDSLLSRCGRQIAKSWGCARAFVDLALIDPPVRSLAGRHPVVVFWEFAREHQLILVPVTGVSRTLEFQLAVRNVIEQDGHGVGVRLTLSDLESPSLGSDLNALNASLGLTYEDVDLLVDFGIADESNSDFAYVCDRVPWIERWRSFTVIAGAFPKDLQEFKVGQHLLPRHEWSQWLVQVLSSLSKLPRVPTFGDYTIQHAIYHEPPPGANVSASIRYTTSAHWLIMRGEGLRTAGSPGHKQYPANAVLLCEREEFCDPYFSYGDEYISKVAKGKITTPGNPETWLRAGINHHLTFVVRQLAATVGA